MRHLLSTLIAICVLNFPSAPNVTLLSNFTTQSRAVININWAVPSCMCGFNVSQVTPKAISMQATAMTDPYSGNSQIIVTGLEPGMKKEQRKEIPKRKERSTRKRDMQINP
jgi:hypothetical protein